MPISAPGVTNHPGVCAPARELTPIQLLSASTDEAAPRAAAATAQKRRRFMFPLPEKTTVIAEVVHRQSTRSSDLWLSFKWVRPQMAENVASLQQGAACAA